MVIAAAVEERSAGVNFGGFDFGDEDGMIAGNMGSDDDAAELYQSIFKKWDAAGCPAKPNSQFLFFAGILF